MVRQREIPVAEVEGIPLVPLPIAHSLGPKVLEAIERLSPADREVIRMYAWERLSFGEIAQELGLADRRGGHARVKAVLGRLRVELEKIGVTYADD